MKTVKINGNNYPVLPMDVNMLCDLEDMGISMSEMQTKAFSFIRAIVSIWMGVDTKKAGREIELHLINGGTLEDIMDAVKDAMESSDFFRHLTKTTAEETPTEKSEKK